MCCIKDSGVLPIGVRHQIEDLAEIQDLSSHEKFEIPKERHLKLAYVDQNEISDDLNAMM